MISPDEGAPRSQNCGLIIANSAGRVKGGENLSRRESQLARTPFLGTWLWDADASKLRLMTPFQYVDFYDVPRTIVLRVHGRWLLLRSAFDERADEYETEYSVYPLPGSFEPIPEGVPWKFLDEIELRCIGKISVREVQFDPSKRKQLDASILENIATA
jgi:hypothetical protein